MSRRSDPPPPPRKKPVREVVEEIWQGVLDVVEDLVTPPPQLVPVPVRNPSRRRR